MQIIIPVKIAGSALSSSSVAEPDAGEVAWVSGATYAVGDKRILVATHRVYSCVEAHTGSTVTPNLDVTKWVDSGPTNKWAMFDDQCSTQTTATTSLTVVLRPGFINAIAFYKIAGAAIAVTVKDAPDGAEVASFTGDLATPPLDWYDWAFGQYRLLDKVIFSAITPYPDAEVSITITGTTVACGMVVVGDLRNLLDGAEFGGVNYGATAEPVDYSYIKTDDYGNTTIVKRRSATDMSVVVTLPQSYSDAALEIIQSVLATPVACIASRSTGYDGLNVFGLVTGSLSYESHVAATLNIKVKGLV